VQAFDTLAWSMMTLSSDLAHFGYANFRTSLYGPPPR